MYTVFGSCVITIGMSLDFAVLLRFAQSLSAGGAFGETVSVIWIVAVAVSLPAPEASDLKGRNGGRVEPSKNTISFTPGWIVTTFVSVSENTPSVIVTVIGAV